MTFALLAALMAATGTPFGPAPRTVVIATARGESRIDIRTDPEGGLVLPAPLLLAALSGGSLRLAAPWAEVKVHQFPFRFLLGAPLLALGSDIQPLAGMAMIHRDTLFLPLQFVTDILPRRLAERYRYEPKTARLVELTPPPGKPAPIPPRVEVKRETRLPNGLRPGHVVAIDPGHGGVDPGNPGLYFPRGVREKDVTLQVGLLLREELQSRGVTVRMTRTTDTLIDLRHRGGYCTASCDLFLSLHINSLPRRSGFTTVRGFETYFLAEARTEDAARVARMENEAVRFEQPTGDAMASTGLDFILKDLQLNEHLRESARIAQLVQDQLARIHPGDNRGVKQAGLVVLNTARRPAVLVELGFSTNPEDGRLLSGRASQRALASSLADAVVAYLLEYERRAGVAGDSGRTP